MTRRALSRLDAPPLSPRPAAGEGHPRRQSRAAWLVLRCPVAGQEVEPLASFWLVGRWQPRVPSQGEIRTPILEKKNRRFLLCNVTIVVFCLIQHTENVTCWWCPSTGLPKPAYGTPPLPWTAVPLRHQNCIPHIPAALSVHLPGRFCSNGSPS